MIAMHTDEKLYFIFAQFRACVNMHINYILLPKIMCQTLGEDIYKKNYFQYKKINLQKRKKFLTYPRTKNFMFST